jgi:hypothetical protein
LSKRRHGDRSQKNETQEMKTHERPRDRKYRSILFKDRPCRQP